MSLLRVLLIAIAALASSASPAVAAPADLDPTWAGDGVAINGLDYGPGANPALGMAIEPGTGKVVVAGYDGDAVTDVAVARYLPDGSLDPAFSGDGKYAFGFAGGGVDDSGYDVAVQDDGKVVIVGTTRDSNGFDRFAVARLEADGDPDPTFGAGGKRVVTFTESNGKFDLAKAVALDGGRIVVGGRVATDASGYRAAVVRLTPDGDLDLSFSGDGRRVFGTANASAPDEIHDIVVQPDRRPVAVGSSGTTQATTRWSTWRITEEGQPDAGFDGDGHRFTTFGDDGDDAIYWPRGVALDGERIVTVGERTHPGDPQVAVARLTADGQLDPAFSGDGRATPLTGPNAVAASVGVDGGGRALVLAATDGKPALIRLTGNGQLDGAFADGGVAQLALGVTGQV